MSAQEQDPIIEHVRALIATARDIDTPKYRRSLPVMAAHPEARQTLERWVSMFDANEALIDQGGPAIKRANKLLREVLETRLGGLSA